MAIVQTVDFHSFVNAFETSQYRNNFTREGLRVLFDYLEQLSEETSTTIELDLCSIVCDYNENTIDEIIQDYSIEVDPEQNTKEQIMNYLHDRTMLVGEVSNGFVYCAF
jgi:hypothetical protein